MLVGSTYTNTDAKSSFRYHAAFWVHGVPGGQGKYDGHNGIMSVKHTTVEKSIIDSTPYTKRQCHVNTNALYGTCQKITRVNKGR